MTRYLLFLILFAMMAFAGCSTKMASFTVVSTKLVEFDRAYWDKNPRERHVVGKDVRTIFLIFPLGSQPTPGIAVDDALTQARGDVMTDAELEYFWWYFPLLYGEHGWRITGDVVRTRPN